MKRREEKLKAIDSFSGLQVISFHIENRYLPTWITSYITLDVLLYSDGTLRG